MGPKRSSRSKKPAAVAVEPSNKSAVASRRGSSRSNSAAAQSKEEESTKAVEAEEKPTGKRRRSRSNSAAPQSKEEESTKVVEAEEKPTGKRRRSRSNSAAPQSKEEESIKADEVPENAGFPAAKESTKPSRKDSVALAEHLSTVASSSSSGGSLAEVLHSISPALYKAWSDVKVADVDSVELTTAMVALFSALSSAEAQRETLLVRSLLASPAGDVPTARKLIEHIMVLLGRGVKSTGEDDAGTVALGLATLILRSVPVDALVHPWGTSEAFLESWCKALALVPNPIPGSDASTGNNSYFGLGLQYLLELLGQPSLGAETKACARRRLVVPRARLYIKAHPSLGMWVDVVDAVSAVCHPTGEEACAVLKDLQLAAIRRHENVLKGLYFSPLGRLQAAGTLREHLDVLSCTDLEALVTDVAGDLPQENLPPASDEERRKAAVLTVLECLAVPLPSPATSLTALPDFPTQAELVAQKSTVEALRLSVTYGSFEDLITRQLALARLEAGYSSADHLSSSLRQAQPRVDKRGVLTIAKRQPLVVPVHRFTIHQVIYPFPSF